MQPRLNRIVIGDCLEGMRRLPEGLVDLAFADPPFNIGYRYDKYDDRRPRTEYLSWSQAWMSEVKRILKPAGAFWLAIGDEYAAELKVLATHELGFTCRSWVVWYYTFGVHCESKFTRSHAHLFHFVVNPREFKFNDAAIRVPSARQLVYADRRANPRGRVPDDTWIVRPAPEPSWILRPQDLPNGFSADSDLWYFPRVCGTFRERMGFHGCQMPEQLLGRIIRVSSDENDVVFDPFVGSGTTLAVAKKLGRRYLGFELSSDYGREARCRLDRARVGAPLDGAESPLQRARPSGASVSRRTRTAIRPRQIRGLTDIEREILDAFEAVHDGFSADRVVADPAMNAEFLSRLSSRGVDGEPADWNLALLRMRKANRLRARGNTRRTKLDAEKVEQCELAAEIALRQIHDQHEVTLDTLLCVPTLAREFDQLASEICPGLEALYYRWAALRIRKYRKGWREAARQVAHRLPSLRFCGPRKCASDSPGLYAVRVSGTLKYVGDTASLGNWLGNVCHRYDFSRLVGTGAVDIVCRPLDVRNLELTESLAIKGAKSVVIKRKRPAWNLQDLAA